MEGEGAFGVQAGSGDGFGELAQLDRDRSGFVDEGDPAFGRLYLWDGTQGGKLVSLAEAGIGALSTASAATPITVTDPSGNSVGQARATGVWVGESGQAGAMQQVDVKV